MSDLPSEVFYRGKTWKVEQRGVALIVLTGPGVCFMSRREVERMPEPRKGKPRGKYGLISDDRLREFHAEHLEGKSIRQLGREIWVEVGYASDHSASMAISEGFKRLGLERRLRSTATAAANRKRKDPANGRTKAEYKRIKRRQAGGYRPCQGVKKQPPRKGEPCDNWALTDSDFCRGHDPRYRDEIQSHLREARAKIGAAA